MEKWDKKMAPSEIHIISAAVTLNTLFDRSQIPHSALSELTFQKFKFPKELVFPRANTLFSAYYSRQLSEPKLRLL